MGGDCSHWYLRKGEETKQRRGGREGESRECVVFLSLVYGCLVHMTSKSTSELASAEVCWAGWASVRPDYFAFITMQSKQLSWLSPSKMSSTPHLPLTTHPHPSSHPDRFSLFLKKSGNLHFGAHTHREAGKWRKAAEQADMSLFGQECNNERGERGACWTRRRVEGGRNICLHFPEPISPSSSSSFSSHGRQQPWRGKRKKKKKKVQIKRGWVSLI